MIVAVMGFLPAGGVGFRPEWMETRPRARHRMPVAVSTGAADRDADPKSVSRSSRRSPPGWICRTHPVAPGGCPIRQPAIARSRLRTMVAADMTPEYRNAMPDLSAIHEEYDFLEPDDRYRLLIDLVRSRTHAGCGEDRCDPGSRMFGPPCGIPD